MASRPPASTPSVYTLASRPPPVHHVHGASPRLVYMVYREVTGQPRGWLSHRPRRTATSRWASPSPHRPCRMATSRWPRHVLSPCVHGHRYPPPPSVHLLGNPLLSPPLLAEHRPCVDRCTLEALGLEACIVRCRGARLRIPGTTLMGCPPTCTRRYEVASKPPLLAHGRWVRGGLEATTTSTLYTVYEGIEATTTGILCTQCRRCPAGLEASWRAAAHSVHRMLANSRTTAHSVHSVLASSRTPRTLGQLAHVRPH